MSAGVLHLLLAWCDVGRDAAPLFVIDIFRHLLVDFGIFVRIGNEILNTLQAWFPALVLLKLLEEVVEGIVSLLNFLIRVGVDHTLLIEELFGLHHSDVIIFDNGSKTRLHLLDARDDVGDVEFIPRLVESSLVPFLFFREHDLFSQARTVDKQLGL